MRSKLRSWAEMLELRRQMQGRLVFTNGCFDILHKGHVLYLCEAKKLGDELVVGLNSDDSVRRLKGSSRPVNMDKDRAIVLSALESVDHVVIFDQDTPRELIELLQPDVLVKGGDWKPEDIVGSDIVLQSGGIVKSLVFYNGYSTTGIIARMEGEE